LRAKAVPEVLYALYVWLKSRVSSWFRQSLQWFSSL